MTIEEVVMMTIEVVVTTKVVATNEGHDNDVAIQGRDNKKWRMHKKKKLVKVVKTTETMQYLDITLSTWETGIRKSQFFKCTVLF